MKKLFLSCLPISYSVIMSETSTLLITFEQCLLEFQNSEMSIPFRGFQLIWPRRIDLGALKSVTLLKQLLFDNIEW